MSDLIWREENSFLRRSFTRHTVGRALHDLAIAPNYKPFWARLMWRRTSLGDVLGLSVDAPIGCKQEFVSASETAAGDPVDFRANEAFDHTGQIFVESHEASQEYLAESKTPG